MKALLKLLFLLAGMGLAVMCSESDIINEDLSDSNLKSARIVNHDAPGLDQDRWVTMKNLDLDIHYRIIGKGPIDLVFLPGWTNPLTVYSKQFDYFRDKARCIYVDFPGQGMSNAPVPGNPMDADNPGFQYTAELLAEAVYDVVKKEGLHQFVAVGFSMGPAIWAMFERNYPGMITKLVAIDGDIAPWPTDPTERDARQAVREATYWAELSWDETIKEMLVAFLIPPELAGDDAEELKEFGKYFITYPSDILADMAYNIEAENVQELVGWAYPILAFYSDPDTDMEKVNLVYPNNTTYFFPGGGHVIHWMFHEEINPMIWEFVKDKPGKKY
ncbi:alpha/beta fold hydrolase [Mangrovibacterium diazotrophicum]|uniref:Pimeloyl-ACP methyl ester carboxylesterase n=1 Tax=Mangrovibacterium diazotrophicum TaxID=1261403 RepID=A0A419W6J1_9BACT|nr:alpha/beta hydrolase [Mangrovibacterium diazotrophicum]RKD91040.1 pimeloyl-ACP methyl ester carboxylesterase [Mangrovibacterium diazotrophicum]